MHIPVCFRLYLKSLLYTPGFINTRIYNTSRKLLIIILYKTACLLSTLSRTHYICNS